MFGSIHECSLPFKGYGTENKLPKFPSSPIKLPSLANIPKKLTFKPREEINTLLDFFRSTDNFDEFKDPKHSIQNHLKKLFVDNDQWSLTIIKNIEDYISQEDDYDFVENQYAMVNYAMAYETYDLTKTLNRLNPGTSRVILAIFESLRFLNIYTPAKAYKLCQIYHWQGEDSFDDFKNTYISEDFSEQDFEEEFCEIYTDSDVTIFLPEWSFTDIKKPTVDLVRSLKLKHTVKENLTKIIELNNEISHNNDWLLSFESSFPCIWLDYNTDPNQEYNFFMQHLIDESYQHMCQIERPSINGLFIENLMNDFDHKVKTINKVIKLHQLCVDTLKLI
jgi:hypothetical protein